MHPRQSPGPARLWMIAIFLAATAAPALAQEQVTITGTIAAKTTGEPLAGAFVTIVETGATALTDAQGAYMVEVPPGSYTMSVEMIGFTGEQRPITVEPGGPATVDFQLPDDPRFAEVIVVVGSRTERSQIATPVPVDVITAETIAESGQTETNQVLATVAPSYQASHQAISDGTDHIDPASLRGLGPDQTLVLVNGKRRHSSALLNVNGTFGRGTVGVDLNAIPTSAIARIEVLRDGAASQYGSDAIAGVVNIVLKDYAEVGEVSAATGITGSGDGEQFKAGANYGVKLGKSGGYLNLTGEFVGRGRTNRTAPWDGQIFVGIPDAINDSSDNAATDAELERLDLTRRDFTMEVGQSGALVGMLYLNAMYPLGEDLEAYAFAGYTYRKGYASGFYRLPSQEDRNVPEVYEFGFLPEINPVLNDLSATTGLRATWGKWNSDYSVSYGSNAFQYFIENSINASLGADSPTSFDAGTLSFAQTMANADFLRTIETSAFKALSLVFGGEYRHENFSIGAGQEESYIAGDELTESGGRKAPGAQVFPGFQPSNAVSAVRESQSAYVGVESELSERFLLDLGGRYEHYTDFGNALIGKVAGRYSVIKDKDREVALRAAANTGFRAPSLHQIWFSSVSTQFVTNPATMELEPREVLNSNNLDPVTAAFGIPRLDQETSVNFSAGITAKPIKNLTVSADFYRIAIDDRIVLTTQFATGDPIIGQEIAEILSDFPQVSAAQFFSNAVDTVTNGVDLVVDYGIPMRKGSLSVTASANFTKTLVTDVHLPDAMVEKFAGADEYWLEKLVFFTREEQNRLEDALPRQKGSLTLRYARGPITGVARGSYYGSVTGKSAVGPDEVERYPDRFTPDSILDETFGAKVLFDLDLSYKLGKLRLGIGANNLLNTFPDQHTLPGNISGGRFLYSRRTSQFGINGGFYYLRMQYLL